MKFVDMTTSEVRDMMQVKFVDMISHGKFVNVMSHGKFVDVMSHAGIYTALANEVCTCSQKHEYIQRSHTHTRICLQVKLVDIMSHGT